MITEDYCSYEVAKLLKEKGFDEYCLGMWHLHNNKKVFEVHYEPLDYGELRNGILLAPTHQMAMKWLRGKNIIIVPQPEYFSCDKCESWGIDIWAGDNYEKSLLDYPTYEEAVEAALKYCLTIIQIYERDKNSKTT